MLKINMQFFGGRGSASATGDNKASGVSSAPAIRPPEVGARWDSHERKVTYRASFNDASGERVTVSGFLSKSGVINEMRQKGASKEHIDAARAAFKNINPNTYKR